MKWSKGRIYFFLLAIIFCATLTVIPACKGGFPTIDPGSDISAVLSLKTSSSDFGLLEAEADSASLPVEVTNEGSNPVTLSAVQLSDDINFTSDESALPATLSPGESITIICTFHPMESGSLQATLEIIADGYDNSLDTILNGEGNYPPIIGPGMMVYDADPTIAGFYLPDGEHNGKTLYRNYENSQYMLFFHEASGRWVLGDDESISEYSDGERYQFSNKFVHDSPTQVLAWNDQDNTRTSTLVEDDVTGPVISGADFTKIKTKSTILKVYYYYCDSEADAENGSHFTWYRCSAPDEPGVKIEDATGRDYSVASEDMNCYLRVEMIPCAVSGIPDGDAIAGPVSPQILNTIGG